jgi:hypoxanthine phosphoribosyltransferase
MAIDFIGNIVFEEEQILKRVSELGKEITAYYLHNKGPDVRVTTISILKGGFVFLADIIRHIDLDLSVDFMAISNYHQASQASAGVRIIKDLSESISGRNILVIEDIIDTGLTLSYILRNLKSRSPNDVKVCTLLDRAVRRITPLEIDYRGFEVGEEYLVGYGLDYMQKWRNLKYICAMKGPEANNQG